MTAVVGALSEISFAESRRLQLTVEQSGVTCFILRVRPRNLNTDGMPGVGFPRWNVELLKVHKLEAGMLVAGMGGGSCGIFRTFLLMFRSDERKPDEHHNFNADTILNNSYAVQIIWEAIDSASLKRSSVKGRKLSRFALLQLQYLFIDISIVIDLGTL